MSYVPLCNLPNFTQSVPGDGVWRLKPDSAHGGLTWENVETGASVAVPSIWYNQPGRTYANSLRYNAERSEESAKRLDNEPHAWSRRDADYMHHQARRLRAMALLCDRHPEKPAGHIDFRGLSDPTTPRHLEAEICAAIEQGA